MNWECQSSGTMHCLSFDVEEHFQVSAFESPMRRRNWDRFESRVEQNTRRILDLLRGKGTRATFFVLGWIAERYPALIREIDAEGHEIASHGYAHELITAQTPTSFRADVRKAKGILEDTIAKPVQGYRAPSFTITEETRWALSILVEEGYIYDSSIFPVVHDSYGIPGADPWCHVLKTASGPLWEVPLTTGIVLGMRIPIAGGGYFRLFPYPVLRLMLRKVEMAGHHLVMYLHPWELDPNQPQMNGPWLSQFRHYLNLDKTESRLLNLLSDFKFGPVCDIVKSVRARIQALERQGDVATS